MHALGSKSVLVSFVHAAMAKCGPKHSMSQHTCSTARWHLHQSQAMRRGNVEGAIGAKKEISARDRECERQQVEDDKCSRQQLFAGARTGGYSFSRGNS